jgi:hypothetical protein
MDNEKMRPFVTSVLSNFSEKELEKAIGETDDEKRLYLFKKMLDAWLTKRLQALFPWVEHAEVDKDSGAITIKHSYPEGVNLSACVQAIMRENLPEDKIVEIRDIRVAPSCFRQKNRVEEVP